MGYLGLNNGIVYLLIKMDYSKVGNNNLLRTISTALIWLDKAFSKYIMKFWLHKTKGWSKGSHGAEFNELYCGLNYIIVNFSLVLNSSRPMWVWHEIITARGHPNPIHIDNVGLLIVNIRWNRGTGVTESNHKHFAE